MFPLPAYNLSSEKFLKFLLRKIKKEKIGEEL
jgi:hypothetical protein